MVKTRHLIVSLNRHHSRLKPGRNVNICLGIFFKMFTYVIFCNLVFFNFFINFYGKSISVQKKKIKKIKILDLNLKNLINSKFRAVLKLRKILGLNQK